MNRRWLSRALIVLAFPVAVSTVSAPAATAAPAGPGVPSVTQVAAIYPHMAGGTANESTSKVYGPGRKCKQGKAIKGASARFASYQAPYDVTDPTSFELTGARPGLMVSAMRFPSVKSAVKYLHGSSKSTKKCPAGAFGGSGAKVKTKLTPIRFKLGDERWGYKATVTMSGRTFISDTLFVRAGRFVVFASATSMDGTAPSVPKAIQLTKVALKAAKH